MSDSQWDEVERVADVIGRVLHGENFGVVVNALLMLLATTGAQADLSKQEFLSRVYGTLDEMYKQFPPVEGDEHGNSALQ
jgi:hypothetical protein